MFFFSYIPALLKVYREILEKVKIMTLDPLRSLRIYVKIVFLVIVIKLWITLQFLKNFT